MLYKNFKLGIVLLNYGDPKFCINLIKSLIKIREKFYIVIIDNFSTEHNSKKLKVDCVEIHTGKLCNLINKKKNYKKELLKIKKAVDLGNKLGLEVHAGHGLTYQSAKILSRLKGIQEYNIGHFLIGEAIFVGLSNSIKSFKKILKS